MGGARPEGIRLFGPPTDDKGMRLLVSLGFAIWIVGAGGWLLSTGDGRGLRALRAELSFPTRSEAVR